MTYFFCFTATRDAMFTVKCDDGIKAKSFKPNDKVYIAPDKLLPLTRFTNPQKASGGGGRGGGCGGGSPAFFLAFSASSFLS